VGDVHSRITPWLCPGWLPLGKLALLKGDPGLGKSLITLDLCARLTTGRDFPDGCPAVLPCNVILVNAEDTLDDTVRTRLDVLDFMQDQQISERTLKRGKQTLGVRSVWVDVGKKKVIYWLLPGQPTIDRL
jgi:hypothetical protein